MMTFSSRAAATVFASLLLMGSALAQTTAPAAKTETAAPAASKKESMPRTPESLECSKQADEKGLKGKERHKFRRACMKDARAAADKK
jgi:hypothetical protein